MSLKECSYCDCENYVLENIACGKFTMFRFPKEQERYDKWLELGNVKKPPNFTDKTILYMCSVHFDPKFLAVNQRRTALIKHALPNPYIASNNKVQNESQVHCKDNLSFVAESIDSESNDGKIESTTSTTIISEVIHNHRDSKINMSVKPANLIEGSNERSAIKRRKVEVISPESTQIKVHNKESEERSEEYTQLEFAISELFGNNVTTFIFKGEEYVQMTKEYYMQEKINLLLKIREYEQVLKRIKQNISKIDID